MKDVGMSKPKKHANKVGRLTQDAKLNKPLPYKPYIHVSTYTAIKQNTKSCTYTEYKVIIKLSKKQLSSETTVCIYPFAMQEIKTQLYT